MSMIIVHFAHICGLLTTPDKLMTTHPILSYPINPGLKEFQFFNYLGKTYYVINCFLATNYFKL